MKFGVLGHLVLGLLAQGDQTGYELTRNFDITLANVWAASHSQIYPELAKLEAAGLIRKAETGPRGSQRYAIEPAGRDELADWLANSAPGDSPRAERMARVFFLGLLPPERALAYLAEQEQAHRAKLARYEAYAEECKIDDPSQRWFRVALEAGIRTERAMADWAAWSVKTLQENP
jgi:DNA-binding PadR family transcriptional regulator